MDANMVSIKKYEIMILLTETLNENEVKAWVFNLGKLLRKLNVSDISVISLGKLTLSYPIHNKRKGTYIKLTFSGIPKFVNNISKLLQMDSHILRYLVMNPEQ